MSFAKRNTFHLLRTTGLSTLAFLLLLNGRGDEPADKSWEAIYGLTPKQLEQDKQDAKLYGITLLELEQGKELGLTPRLLLAARNANLQLENEYKMALNSPEGASQVQASLRKAIANIDAASTPVLVNGNNLPASFTDLLVPKQGDPAMLGVFKPGFMGLSPDDYIDQHHLILAGKLMVEAPEVIMPILQERAKVFPPTAADYILYFYVITYLDDYDSAIFNHDPTTVPLSRRADLLTMARAKNPVYRFLAASAADLVEPDQTKRLNFYTGYLNETDPFILTGVIERVAEFKTPAALSLLQSFQPAVQKTGDTKLTAHLQEQIQRLKQ